MEHKTNQEVLQDFLWALGPQLAHQTKLITEQIRTKVN